MGDGNLPAWRFTRPRALYLVGDRAYTWHPLVILEAAECSLQQVGG